jgi:hypothetical protein
VRATIRFIAVALVAAVAGAAAPPAGAQQAAPPEQAPAAEPAAADQAAPAAPQVFPFAVHGKKLGNGLQVYAIPYDSPGTVAYFTVVRTGSRQEVEAGHSGFAHFFEHMMFRGTESYPTEAYNDVLKRMGADSNAFTTDDYTNYYIIGPAAELETMMEIEADRFQNLEYGEEAFRTEALAILGEYNKNASSPFLPMYERMRELAFTKHTYRHTTMGFLADIEAMPGYYDYSLAFFDRFYRPENSVLLIVGDSTPKRARPGREALRRLGEGLQAGDVAGRAAAAGAQDRPRRLAERDAAAPDDGLPRACLRRRLDGRPRPRRPGAAPVLRRGAALPGAGGRQAVGRLRLRRRLVPPRPLPVHHLQPGQERRPAAEGRAAIAAHVEKLKEEPVDAARLERVKSHLRYASRSVSTPPGRSASPPPT